MKKLIIIFSVLSLLIFIRPVLGLNTNMNSTTNSSISTTQVEGSEEVSVFDGAFSGIRKFYSYTGFANATTGNVIMIIVGIVFIYLGIKYDFEPLLLIPIGTGVIIGNIHSSSM